MRYVVIFLGVSVCSFCILLGQSSGAQNSVVAVDTIHVGVRADAAPFSYRTESSPSASLDDYRGYVIELCKEVLAEVIKSAPFKDAQLTAKEVDAGGRFSPLRLNGDVDLLCGPTSATADRLDSFLISLPIYLTGATVASLNLRSEGGSYPESLYCRSIVGYVANTTSENPGLSILASEGRFDRFSPAIDHFLKQLDVNQDGTFSKASLEALAGLTLPDSMHENICAGAFLSAPIRRFDSHIKGLAAFCNEEILYYVADVDIIADYLRKNAAECAAYLDRKVAFIEQYAIFFRTVTVQDVESGNAKLEDLLRSQLLYSSFNQALMRLSRLDSGVFERAYSREFGKDRPRTSALEDFFRSLSYGLR
ncbi:MAG: transporter substrate-binding domain-containing protein [Roseovarius sp.]|jgi:hypothetical protein|uniref:transporter substrate-binding domain-containing protein n=1 Tax=Roseovarius sp. TaxID=1486281 RepID=UPI0032EDDF5D